MSRLSNTSRRDVRIGFAALVGLSWGLISGCPPVDDNGVPPKGNTGLTGKYVGSARCSLCHINAHTNWSQTLHAGALDTLEAMGQDTNSICLPCHTVGFGQSGGFVDRATTDDLAGGGCETCHGPARDHVENIEDRSLRPTVSLSSALCAVCHTGEHHPHSEEWSESGHAHLNEAVAGGILAGATSSVQNCGLCHSGDVFVAVQAKGRTIADGAFVGLTDADLHPITCAVCHDPHRRTGNAAAPDEGRDFQLRFSEVATPQATNSIAAATDRTRFNLCGQCHHSRGRVWTDTARAPHHSIQSNVYVGEMPMPVGQESTPLVFSRVSVHSFAPEQCATCHLFRQDFQSEVAPAISGHTFTVDFNSCALSGCHPSVGQASAVQATLSAEFDGRLATVRQLLGDPATWEYSSAGGPEDQSALSDAVKQARFLYYYALYDGSKGMHNPAYVRDMLIKAEQLLRQD